MITSTDKTVDAETALTKKSLCSQDTIWMLSLYGTAVGAGTLFLPVNAGLHGFWPLIIMTLLAFPMTYYSHRALCRFVLSGSGTKDITEVMDEHFGEKAGKILTFLYLFAIYPIILMYSVAITNTTNSFIVNQLGYPAPPRALLALILILALMAIIRFGQEIILRFMSMMVYPFIITLILFALYLIQYWNTAMFQTLEISATGQGFWVTIWLLIPVMVFSFNHSPIISSFAVQQKERYGEQADKNSLRILRNSHLLMVGTVLFFVFSCVLSLSPQDLVLAKAQNISILSYLANYLKTPSIALIAPLIAFIAIAKSFLGHYLGAKEGLYTLIHKLLDGQNRSLSDRKIHLLIDLLVVLSCWLVATLNPNILRMIESLSGPVIAIILFLVPIYATYKVPAMRKYSAFFISNTFVTVIGLIAISAIVYGLF